VTARAASPRIVVGISGASGAPYAARLLGFLADLRDGKATGGPVPEVAVVLTKTARVVWADEIGTDPESYGFPVYNPLDMTAPFASGSARYDACVVIPCSAGMLSRIAHGTSSDLVGRCADVMLKERKKLLLVLRESPYSLVHLRNMIAVTEAGAMVMPASPSFYSRPKTLDQLLDTVTARVLDQLGIDNDLMTRWAGLRPRETA
jgi:4-hydroxy-3-polyprenylbenzoate decarboxylase